MKFYHIIRRKDYLTGHPENFKIKLDFVSHITNKKIYYKVTKENYQMVFLHLVSLCYIGG